MLRNLIQKARKRKAYRLTLARQTPLVYGLEARAVANALFYDDAALVDLSAGAVCFEPRETYFNRALEWANGECQE